MSTPLEAALELAGWGIPTFPCLATKAPAIAGGFKAASTDPAIVRAMFAGPGAVLVGVPTGAASGFDALDIDPRHGGDRWWSAHAGWVPQTRVHRTRSGGLHVLFIHNPEMKNTASKLAPGVDTRGSGGYVVWWPATGEPVTDHPVTAWPSWLLKLLLAKPPTIQRTQGQSTAIISQSGAERIVAVLLRRLSHAPDGAKHITLRKAAWTLGGLLRELPYGRDEAARLLVEAVQSAGATNLANAARTAAWGLERGANAPLGTVSR